MIFKNNHLFAGLLCLLLCNTLTAQNIEEYICVERIEYQGFTISLGTSDGLYDLNDSVLTLSSFTGDAEDRAIFESSRILDLERSRSYYFALGLYENENRIYMRENQSSEWMLVYTHPNGKLTRLTRSPKKSISVIGQQGQALVSQSYPFTTWEDLKIPTEEDLTTASIGKENEIIISSKNQSFRYEIREDFDPSRITWQVIDQGFELLTYTHYGDYLGYSDGKLLVQNSNSWEEDQIFMHLQGEITYLAPDKIGTTKGLYYLPKPIWFDDRTAELLVESDGKHVIDAMNDDYKLALFSDGETISTLSHNKRLPFAGFQSQNGSCTDSLVQFTNNSIRYGYEHEWFINDSLISEDHDFSYVFENSGTYEVKMKVTNPDYDTFNVAIKNFEVVNKPLPATFLAMDTVLCHSGVAEILLDSADRFHIFQLLDLNNNKIADSQQGTDGRLILSTGEISDSTRYTILRRSVSAECVVASDKFLVAVEQTKADFKPAYFNASEGESVKLLNKSSQSSSYFWESAKESTFSSATATEPFVTFYHEGNNHPIQLVAESAHGCRDTIVVDELRIYDQEKLPEYNWAISHAGTDDRWNGYDHRNNLDAIHVTKDNNYLVGGSFFENTFTSTLQNSSVHKESGGAFLAQYSPRGVLQWLVYGNTKNDDNIVNEIVSDKAGNVYVGFQRAHRNENLYDNSGNLFRFASGGPSLAKFDPYGRLVWIRYLSGSSIDELTIGPGNAIYAFVHASHPFKPYLCKFDEHGNEQWSFDMIEGSDAQGSRFTEIETDALGNIYFMATMGSAFFLDREGNRVRNDNFTYSGASNAALAKYDSAGRLQWITEVGSYTTSFNKDTYDYAWDFKVTADGTSYLAVGGPRSNTAGFIVPSQNGAVDTIQVSNYAMVAMDTDGNMKWATGVKQSNVNFNFADQLVRMALDEQGYIYNIGMSQGTTRFISADSSITTIESPSRGATNFWITKYDEDGQLEWVNMGADISEEKNYGIYRSIRSLAIDRKGDLVVAGDFRTNGDKPGKYYHFAYDSVFLHGQDNFMMKFNPLMSDQEDLLLLDLPSGKLCKGSTVEFPYRVRTENTISTTNQFILQLLIRNGANEIIRELATVNSTQRQGTISAQIPESIPKGLYAVRLVASGSSHLISKEVKVMFGEKPEGIRMNLELCQNESIQLRATRGLSYQWSPKIALKDTGRLAVVNPVESITYETTVNHLCGTVQDVFEINVLKSDKLLLETINICEGESAEIFGKEENQSGVYELVFNNKFGCDSIISRQLIVWPVSETVQPLISLCEGEAYEFYGQSVTESGTYTQQFTTQYGCDSIITQEVLVSPEYYEVISELTICKGESIELFDVSRNTSGIYEKVLTTQYGCDSIIAIDLTVQEFDMPYTFSGNTVFAGDLTDIDPLMTYQWLDCNNGMQPIFGEVTFTYVSFEPFNVAIVVTKDGCSDTLACTANAITDVSSLPQNMQIYPNPSDGGFTVNTGLDGLPFEVSIIDLTGNVVHQASAKKTEAFIQADLPAGTYLIIIQSASGTVREKIVIRE